MKMIDFDPTNVIVLTKTECHQIHAGNCCPGTPQEPIDPAHDPKDPDTGTDN